jgi:hypothetical protein
MNDQWLLLTDYASKYRVSVSTLRRRIKNNQINFRFDGGKYYISDIPPRSAESEVAGGNLTFPGIRPFTAQAAPILQEAEDRLRQLRENQESRLTTHSSAEERPEPAREYSTPSTPVDHNEEPIISTATRLLSELKRAYMNILHEKEEQIIQLKEEVSDLKTLVRVLEDDNDRMRKIFLSAPESPSVTP